MVALRKDAAPASESEKSVPEVLSNPNLRLVSSINSPEVSPSMADTVYPTLPASPPGRLLSPTLKALWPEVAYSFNGCNCA